MLTLERRRPLPNHCLPIALFRLLQPPSASVGIPRRGDQDNLVHGIFTAQLFEDTNVLQRRPNHTVICYTMKVKNG